MALIAQKQQISINDDRAIIAQVDALAARIGLTRPELYACAIRKLLKDPAATVAEIMTDRIVAMKEQA